MLFLLIHLSFSNIYIQDFRSSTIEPFYEKLPDHIQNVNLHESIVLYWERLDFPSSLR